MAKFARPIFTPLFTTAISIVDNRIKLRISHVLCWSTSNSKRSLGLPHLFQVSFLKTIYGPSVLRVCNFFFREDPTFSERHGGKKMRAQRKHKTLTEFMKE